MEQTPLVSIIIDNYNYARFLPEAIESVINQTYPRQEIIVVDDGSTDQSRQVIARYGNLVTAIFKENGGQASAFNAGYAACHGEIIALLDADDYWHPEKIAHVVAAALAEPRANVICHPMQNVDANSEPFGEAWPQPMFSGDLKELVITHGGWWPRPPTSALAFRRAFMERVMPLPGHKWLYIAPDAYLGGLAPLMGTVVSLPQALTYYRVHGGNMWARNAQAKKEPLWIDPCFGAMNDYLRQHGFNVELDPQKNFLYQTHLFLSLNDLNLFQLSRLALSYPGEPFLFRRWKIVAKLWLHLLGIRRDSVNLRKLLPWVLGSKAYGETAPTQIK